MAVRSLRFLTSSAVPSGAAGAEYTVPSGHTAIIKQVTFYGSSGTTDTTGVLEVTPVGLSATRLINVPVVHDTSVLVSGLFIVAEPGDVIRLRRGTGSLSAQVSGALLDGVA